MNNPFSFIGGSLIPPRRQIEERRPGPQNWSIAGFTGADVPLPKGNWDAQRAIAQGLQVCSWVYACVEMRAKGVSSVPWIAQRRIGRAANSRHWERDFENKYERLLENPNSRMTRKFLMHFQSMHLDTGGNALFKKVFINNGRDVAELWPLSPIRAQPLPDDEWIGSYRIYDIGGFYDIPYDLVIHAQRPNPANPFWGFAPLQVLASTVDSDVAMSKAHRNLAENDNMPAAVISDPSLKVKEQLDLAQQALDARWSARNQKGKPMVLPAGANFIRLTLTPEEAQYIAGRKWNVTEICAPYDILPAIFEPQAATYSNLAASIEYMWEAGIIPQLDILRDAFNLALIAAGNDTVYITYDLSDIKALKVQFTRAIQDFRTLITTGVVPTVANDRLKIGLPRYEGDDKPFVQWRGTEQVQGVADTASGQEEGDAQAERAGVDPITNSPTRQDLPAKLPAAASPSTSTPGRSGKSTLLSLAPLRGQGRDEEK